MYVLHTLVPNKFIVELSLSIKLNITSFILFFQLNIVHDPIKATYIVNPYIRHKLPMTIGRKTETPLCQYFTQIVATMRLPRLVTQYLCT